MAGVVELLRIVCRSGDFGTGDDGFVRVTMGTSTALLRETVRRMALAAA